MYKFEDCYMNPQNFNSVYQTVSAWTQEHINEVHQMD